MKLKLTHNAAGLEKQRQSLVAVYTVTSNSSPGTCLIESNVTYTETFTVPALKLEIAVKQVTQECQAAQAFTPSTQVPMLGVC